MNNRQRIRILLGASALVLCSVTVAGLLLSGSALKTDFSQKNIAPGLTHFFGTDWMGRDMLIRTLAGLSLSIRHCQRGAGFAFGGYRRHAGP